jgi:hypothetical protein
LPAFFNSWLKKLDKNFVDSTLNFTLRYPHNLIKRNKKKAQKTHLSVLSEPILSGSAGLSGRASCQPGFFMRDTEVSRSRPPYFARGRNLAPGIQTA